MDSVVAQSGVDVELIIMDGGSTDGTVEALKANSDRIAYWESKSDRGIYHAWNKALDIARGEWVCFLGADDYFATKDSLSTMMAEAKPGVDLVFGRAALTDNEDRVLRKIGTTWNWSRMKRCQVVAHPGALHRRTLFSNYGYFNENYEVAGDYEFFLRVGGGVAASYVDEVVVFIEDGGVSMLRPRLALKENRQIQAVHPEIGLGRAWANYSVAMLKATLYRILCV